MIFINYPIYYLLNYYFRGPMLLFKFITLQLFFLILYKCNSH